MLTIQDTGPGMPPEVRDRMFEPFFTTKHRGTGLGLSTAKRLIEQHRGEMRADCPPGGGTIVTVSLPAGRTPDLRRQETADPRPHVDAGCDPPFVDDTGPVERVLDVRAHVRVANVLVKLGASHQRARLLAGAAEEQIAARRVQRVRELLERREASAVDRGHVAQPQYDDRRQRRNAFGDHIELVGRPEEERAVDPEDRYVVGDLLVLEDVGSPVLVRLHWSLR